MSEPDEDFGDLNDVVFDFNEEGDLVATNAIAGVDDDDDGEAPVRAGVVVPQTTAARKFMREHKWVDDFQNHAEANEDLIGSPRTLVHDGYSPDDPAYYSELERRMARKHRKTIVTRGGSERSAARTSRSCVNSSWTHKTSSTCAPSCGSAGPSGIRSFKDEWKQSLRHDVPHQGRQRAARRRRRGGRAAGSRGAPEAGQARGEASWQRGLAD